MLLDIACAMRKPGESFPFTHHERIAPQEVCGETVTFDEPVVLEGRFSMSGDELTLDGTLTATAHSRCCNCLEMAQAQLTVPFHEVFVKVERISPEEERDPDCMEFTGSKVELSHLAFTLAMLELPIRFLCRPDCQGYKRMLPPETPEDGGTGDHPFSALKNLLMKDQEV